MTAHLNNSMQMFGSLEHVVGITTVGGFLGQSKALSSSIYLRITQG